MSDKPYPNWVCPHEKQVQAIADAWVAQKEWFRTEWESHDRVPPPPEPNVFVLLDALGGAK